MMKILFFIFILPILGFSQEFNYRKIKVIEQNDSVLISNVFYRNKTTILKPQKEEIKDSIVIYNKTKLSNKNSKKLYQLLKNRKSYLKGAPLTTDFDIEIKFYKNGEVVQTITLSSFTKRITISWNKGDFIGKYSPLFKKEIDEIICREKLSKNKNNKTHNPKDFSNYAKPNYSVIKVLR
ncbi:hypothetical protein [Capnocytophaga gingivalis]|uniref:DUF4412 domain-containing protein n=1 Tax=Capnocytophaga gingivalis TaxID=1017 RepID=A0ABU5Z8Y0_9FLAO|nr:hypothetical protein [Capnocytophaga gingivalis]MEB3075421.1 hypothetical protein [Capnocytophaga gingivalis]